jgi:hypothetical protein
MAFKNEIEIIFALPTYIKETPIINYKEKAE